MTKTLFWVVAIAMIAAVTTGCDPHKARPISGDEKAFHLEHGTSAGRHHHGHHGYFGWRP